eukprot:CAMPEP_0194530458 /NCGR_PEP_ID=MMETSP0253-20130528/67424_1 /TAXON_ID=2966 /ORGANISM="Noctiluca scintillans" /LENGTH=603 /DNA_ID=CAMNT_0039375701 /DNA_START=110 /DNA_END=1918 /DNA_ORIENTATION=+
MSSPELTQASGDVRIGTGAAIAWRAQERASHACHRVDELETRLRSLEYVHLRMSGTRPSVESNESNPDLVQQVDRLREDMTGIQDTAEQVKDLRSMVSSMTDRFEEAKQLCQCRCPDLVTRSRGSSPAPQESRARFGAVEDELIAARRRQDEATCRVDRLAADLGELWRAHSDETCEGRLEFETRLRDVQTLVLELSSRLQTENVSGNTAELLRDTLAQLRQNKTERSVEDVRTEMQEELKYQVAGIHEQLRLMESSLDSCAQGQQEVSHKIQNMCEAPVACKEQEMQGWTLRDMNGVRERVDAMYSLFSRADIVLEELQHGLEYVKDVKDLRARVENLEISQAQRTQVVDLPQTDMVAFSSTIDFLCEAATKLRSEVECVAQVQGELTSRLVVLEGTRSAQDDLEDVIAQADADDGMGCRLLQEAKDQGKELEVFDHSAINGNLWNVIESKSADVSGDVTCATEFVETDLSFGVSASQPPSDVDVLSPIKHSSPSTSARDHLRLLVLGPEHNEAPVMETSDSASPQPCQGSMDEQFEHLAREVEQAMSLAVRRASLDAYRAEALVLVESRVSSLCERLSDVEEGFGIMQRSEESLRQGFFQL